VAATGMFALICLMLTAGVLAASCAGSSGSAGESPAGDSGKCGPAHELPGFDVNWEYFECPMTDTIWVSQAKIGSGEEPLGDRDVSWGMLSVKYHGLYNKYFIAGYNFAIMFKGWGYRSWDNDMQKDVQKEVNWHVWSMRNDEDVLYTRLITQRFDGQCSGRCEQADFSNKIQFKNELEPVQWDCAWSLAEVETDGKVWCTIQKLITGETFNLWGPMNGPYFSLDYAGVGMKAFDGDYPGYPGDVSDFRFTIFK